MHLFRRALVIGAVALVAAGCGHPPPSQPAVGYPFGGVGEPTRDEQALLDTAQDILTARCMHGRGFAYVPHRASPLGQPNLTNPYGLVTVADAAIHGYGMVEVALAPREDKRPNDETRRALPAPRRAAWDAALRGTAEHRRTIPIPGGGKLTYNADSCVHRARHELLGPGWNRLYLAVKVTEAAVVTRTQQAPEVSAAVRQWSTCMRSRGRDLARPADARQAVADALAKASGDPAPVARLELGMARDDAECADTAGLWTAYASAQDRAERDELAGPGRRSRRSRSCGRPPPPRAPGRRRSPPQSEPVASARGLAAIKELSSLLEIN